MAIRPATSCRYWATNRKYPTATKMARKLTISAALNLGTRNNARSIIGSARRAWRRTHRCPTSSPPTPAAIATGPMPSWAICFSPKITASTAAMAIAALARSSRPAFGSRDSGRTRGPRISSATMTGMASRKTEPHQKNSSAIPPRTGPIALPAEKAPIHTPMATVRWRGSWNMKKISPNVAGASVAPAMPRAARLAMSISGVVEKAANSEVMPNAAAPTSSSLRRPMRSPRVPIVIRAPATRKP